MLERLDLIIESVHRAYSLTGFNIDKCPKADQVNNLNEARAWLLDAQSELEALRRDEQRVAARWPRDEGEMRNDAADMLEAQREAK